MRPTLRLPLLVAAACATAALAACGADAGAGASGDPVYATNPDTPMDTKPSPSADTGAADGGGASGGGDIGGDIGGGTTQEETGPRIVSFAVTRKPSCPQGTTVNPIPAQPVELTWNVTGTDRVTLSVDGPGVYKEYDAEGSDTLNFPCGGEDGGTVKHTYTLRTVGGGEVQERTVSATATFHVIQDVSAGTEEQPTRVDTDLPIEETTGGENEARASPVPVALREPAAVSGS
jgi:hypothetical protein